MRRSVFAVCDLEVEYALNFMDFLNRKKNIPFEIQAFTAVENLIDYGKHTHIELLLISGRAMCREVRELDTLISIPVCINISHLLMYSVKLWSTMGQKKRLLRILFLY